MKRPKFIRKSPENVATRTECKSQTERLKNEKQKKIRIKRMKENWSNEKLSRSELECINMLNTMRIIFTCTKHIHALRKLCNFRSKSKHSYNLEFGCCRCSPSPHRAINSHYLKKTVKSARIGCAWRWIWTASCTKLFSSDTTVFMFTFCIAWVFQHRTDFCWPVISHSVHVLNLIYFYKTRKTNARMVRL